MNDLTLDLKSDGGMPENLDRTNDAGVLRPTVEAYEALERAFDFFNLHLFKRGFGIELPHVMLTMPKSRRRQGYFQHDNWQGSASQRLMASEIALNPKFFGSQRKVCQTLVHEMVHLGQAEYPELFGRRSPRGYHNKGFAKTMIAPGLMPSSTGAPGGKRTGVTMSHYVIEGGPFSRSYERFVQMGFSIRWSSGTPVDTGKTPDISVNTEDAQHAHERALKRRSKTKYSCAVCGLNAWTKPQARLACVSCSVLMKEIIK